MINIVLTAILIAVALASAVAVIILRLRAPAISEEELDRLLNELDRAETPETAEERAAQQAGLARILADRPAGTSKSDAPPHPRTQSGRSRPRLSLDGSRKQRKRHSTPAFWPVTASGAHVVALTALTYQHLGPIVAVVGLSLLTTGTLIRALHRHKSVPPTLFQVQISQCMKRKKELP